MQVDAERQQETASYQAQEAYFPLGDATTTLHADVLRSPDVAWDVPQPVILVVSPFTGRSGPFLEYGASGISEYWSEFWEATDLFAEGWTYVQVDLPGFGGSNGCNNWGGALDQQAVVASVEWAAAQPWSTGRVGLFGAAYDGWSPLHGVAHQPEGLTAAVALAPLYSGYRYAYTNGLRIDHTVAAAPIIQGYDVKPGPAEEPEYTARAKVPSGTCYAENIALQQQDAESADYWTERNLIELVRGSQVPLLLNQGLLETSTNQDGAFEAFNGLANPDNRLWVGNYDSSRPWERAGDEPAMGREDLTQQVMDFFDFHVKGLPVGQAPTILQPAVEVHDNLGRWRSEEQWPPADVTPSTTSLLAGSYADDGANTAWGSGAGNGIWSISPELPHDVWFAGEPVVRVTLDTHAPNTNLVANLYDIGPDGRATFVSRGGMLVRDLGSQDASFTLYGQDWLFEDGHRIGVLVSSSNNDWWRHVPTNTTVVVTAASIELPWLTRARTSFVADAYEAADLVAHLSSAVFDLDAGTIAANETPFRLPPDLGQLGY